MRAGATTAPRVKVAIEEKMIEMEAATAAVGKEEARVAERPRLREGLD